MRPKQKTPAAVSDLRLRTRIALLGLEDKDVAHQAQTGIQLLISDLTADWQQHQVLRDILAAEQCNVSARRLRYRYRMRNLCMSIRRPSQLDCLLGGCLHSLLNCMFSAADNFSPGCKSLHEP